MLTQALEIIAPGVPYTSDGTTWESVVFGETTLVKPSHNIYEEVVYRLENVEAIKKMREERNALLDQSDKYVTRDYPHRFELDIQNWLDYRQALRNFPIAARPTLDEDGNLTGVEWPAVPTA